jgi:protein TonB
MAMHFSYSHYGNGSKTGKFMLVAGLHVALGLVLVHTLGTRKPPLAVQPDATLVVIEPQQPEPPKPPPAPPQPVQQLAPPDIVVPKIEVAVAPPPDPSPFQAISEAVPEPMPFAPAQLATQAPPVAHTNTNANSGQMRSAVFADANSCALPDYPPSAARNGETGTTTLALLVGTDGRVSSARIQQSSGSRTLDRAALNALSMCKFKPAMNKGVPEAGWAQMAYVWTLD